MILTHFIYNELLGKTNMSSNSLLLDIKSEIIFFNNLYKDDRDFQLAADSCNISEGTYGWHLTVKSQIYQ